MTQTMTHAPINFAQKFSLFTEQWQPKVIAEINDYQFKISRLQGDFVWHSHPDTDEAFLVIEGSLRIDFRDGGARGPREAGSASWGGSVTLNPGDLYIVPKGVEHKPFAEREVKLLIIEPRGVRNTGDSDPSQLTAPNDVWI